MARLDALEQRLVAQPGDAAVEPVSEDQARQNPDAESTAQPQADIERSEQQGTMLERLRARAYGDQRAAPPVVPPSLSAIPSPDREEAPRPKRTLADLEWLVGAKGIVLVGVLILVIAAGLFLKEAWDRGWVDQVPGWLRCSIGGLFGLALVGVGEVVRRRINPLASSGVSAAGLAIIFGSILAAARLYELLSLPAAFVLLAMTALAGVVMGALSSRVLLAALSLGGAFVVPLVLRSATPSYVIMPAYLIALLGMGLALAGWKGHEFAIVRRIAWWGTAILGSLWGLAILDRSATSPAVFVGVVWAMTIAELAVSARFFTRLRPSIAWPEECAAGFVQVQSDDPITLDLKALGTPAARWINSSFGVTAWASVLAGYAIHRHEPGLAWLAPAILAIASIITAFALAPQRPKLWVPRASARSVLATAMTINAAGLVAATIATGLGGPAEVVAWAIVGTAAVVFGTAQRFHSSVVLGLAFIGVALARLLTFDLGGALWDLQAGDLGTVEIIGLHFSAWSAQLGLVAAALIASAWLLRRSPYRIPVAMVAVAVAGLTLIGPGSSLLSLGAAWAVYGVSLAWLGARWRRFDIRVASNVALSLGSVLVAARTFAGLLAGAPARPDGPMLAWNNASWSLLFVAMSWLAWTARRGQLPVWRAAGVLVAVGSLALALEGDGVPMANSLVVWPLLVLLITLVSIVSERLGRRAGAGVLHRWLLPQISAGLAVLLAGVWLSQQVVTDWSGIDAPPLLHRAILSASLVIAGLGLSGWLVGRARRVPMVRWDQQPANRVFRIVSWSTAGVLALASSSAEVFRAVGRAGLAGEAAPDAALSVWWSLFAVATIVVGMRWRQPALRWAGLGLLGVTSLKVMIVDMAALDGLTRIAGSAVVGLVLLAAGGGYAWVMGRAAADTGESDARKM